MEAGCNLIEEDFENVALKISKKTRDEGIEYAVSICDDESYEVFEGEEDHVEFDRCDQEQLNMHTHPPGNPARPSIQDLRQGLTQYEGDYTNRMCVVGGDEDPTVTCLKINREEIEDNDYVEFVEEVDDMVDEPADIFDIEEEFKFVKMCQTELEG